MKIIYKYPLMLTDSQIVNLPGGASLLSVQMQDSAPQLWALVNPENALAPLTIRMVPTGYTFPDANEHYYLDTFQMTGGTLVFHVFARFDGPNMSVHELTLGKPFQ